MKSFLLDIIRVMKSIRIRKAENITHAVGEVFWGNLRKKATWKA
jgi:hypothetical protein